MSDLFPGVEIPEHDYGRLKEEIEEVTRNNGHQVVDAQIKKVIQLYETMMVRHGVMLVGPTGGGKTVIYKVRVIILITSFLILSSLSAHEICFSLSAELADNLW